MIDDANCGLSDEDALQRALKDSLVLCKPSPPDELCCPITLQLFQDPVKTLHGQTYERAAIEDWLESKSTDPMTGEILKIKALFSDDDMKARCSQYILSLTPQVTRSCGRGGRGGGCSVGGRGGRQR